VSGALLFVSLPFWVYLFSLSLHNEASFKLALGYLTSPWTRLVLLILLWSILHHLFAGIRFLLLDIHLGHSLKSARRSAWLVNFTGAILFVVLALWWLL